MSTMVAADTGRHASTAPAGANDRSDAVAHPRFAGASSPTLPFAGGVLTALLSMWHPMHAVLLVAAMLTGALDIWTGTELAMRRGRYSRDEHNRGMRNKLLKLSQVVYAVLLDAVLVGSGATPWALATGGFLGWLFLSEGQSYQRNLRDLRVERWTRFDAVEKQVASVTGNDDPPIPPAA